MKIAVFAGSSRKGSLNVRLAKAVAAKLEALGADVSLIDLGDYPLPLYNGDLEEAEGAPENEGPLKRLLAAQDGYVVACPEYNGSITPLLKNTIDWLSRKRDGEQQMMAFAGKVAALVGASPGGLGGLRGLRHVREILGNIGVWVAPKQAAIGSAHTVLDADGTVTDEKVSSQLDAVVGQLVTATGPIAKATE